MAINTLRTLNDPDWMKLFKILESDDVSEAQVNGRDSVYVKHKGKRIKISDIRWDSDDEYEESLKNALGTSGFIRSEVPFQRNGSLFEGPIEYKGESGKFIKGRATIVLPPAADVPQLNFAKKTSNLVTLDAIADGGSMNKEMLRFIKAAVYSGCTMVLSGGTGSGKDLHKDTPVPTPDGMRTVGTVEEGDYIFDDLGKPTEVMRKYAPLDPDHYEITFDNGEKVRAGMGHLWRVSMLSEAILSENQILGNEKMDNMSKEASHPSELITTEEMFSRGVRADDGRLNFAVEGIASGVKYPKSDQNFVHPYVLGAWVGNSSSMCGVDELVMDKIADREGYQGGVSKEEDKRSFISDWENNDLNNRLKRIGVIGNKHIPQEYKISSIHQRTELISGLMDTGGWVDQSGRCHVELTNKDVVHGAREVVSSLGWKATKVKLVDTSYTDDNGVLINPADVYSFTFIPHHQIFTVASKATSLEKRLSMTYHPSEQRRNYIVDIEKIKDNPEDYYCFSVDSPDHMFLCTESFIPTHNTTMMEACTKLFPEEERVGVCEDTPELVLEQDNVAYLHSLPWRPGMDEKEVVSLYWVVQLINRIRTDRVIIGETRGKEFADFLIAANSGQEGSMTTIHANDSAQALSKMSNFALKGSGENMPMRAINSDIASAIDLIIQIGYEKTTGRYYTYSITEVSNTINEKTNQITTNKIYEMDMETKVHSRLNPPSDRLRAKIRAGGIDVDEFIGASTGYGDEPQWRKGFGPDSRAPKKERTLNQDNRLNKEQQERRKGGLGKGRTI